MRKRRVPASYIRYLTLMFEDRSTRLRFDDFLSDPIAIDNGGEQGNPIMMIAFLFYNADLIDIAEGETGIDIPTIVDDATIVAEGCDFEETTAKLKHVMEKAGGGLDWAESHNSKFEIDKFAVLHCEPAQTRRDLTRPALRL
ncbi:hypothetical protein BD626DRAFT_399228, partial [Schizophyllum amplum]